MEAQWSNERTRLATPNQTIVSKREQRQQTNQSTRK